MHWSQHKLLYKKNRACPKVKFYLNVHRVFMTKVTNADHPFVCNSRSCIPDVPVNMFHHQWLLVSYKNPLRKKEKAKTKMKQMCLLKYSTGIDTGTCMVTNATDIVARATKNFRESRKIVRTLLKHHFQTVYATHIFPISSTATWCKHTGDVSTHPSLTDNPNLDPDPTLNLTKESVPQKPGLIHTLTGDVICHIIKFREQFK